MATKKKKPKPRKYGREAVERRIASLEARARKDMQSGDEGYKEKALEKRAQALALRREYRGDGPTAKIRTMLLHNPDVSYDELAKTVYGEVSRTTKARVRVIVSRLKVEIKATEFLASEAR